MPSSFLARVFQTVVSQPSRDSLTSSRASRMASGVDARCQAVLQRLEQKRPQARLAVKVAPHSSQAHCVAGNALWTAGEVVSGVTSFRALR